MDWTAPWLWQFPRRAKTERQRLCSQSLVSTQQKSRTQTTCSPKHAMEWWRGAGPAGTTEGVVIRAHHERARPEIGHSVLHRLDQPNELPRIAASLACWGAMGQL
jgi:hypothetical protein